MNIRLSESIAPVALSPLPSQLPVWRRGTATQLLAALAIVIPMAAITWWVASTGDEVTLQTMFLGPLLGGGAMICWILILHLAVCGDTLEILGLQRRGLGVDILLGLVLAGISLAFHVAYGFWVRPLFPARPPSPQIIELLTGVVHNPLLLALWLGPVVWIGIALFEELARCVVLRRLWLAAPRAGGGWWAILLVSVLVGLGHFYQGPASMVSIGLKSVLFGWVYLRTGRIRTLIVGHAIYDSAQIVQAVLALRQIHP